MTRLRFIGLALLAVVLLPMARALGDDARPLRLRVLSYNIHHGEGTDRKLDLARIAEVIKSVSPDVVALQEVDRNVQRSQQVDQPAELARLTGMHATFGRNIPLQGGEYGNAVLTRRPPTRQENHLLPRFDNGEQRGVLQVELDVASDDAAKQAVAFFATHLDHRRDGRERVASAQKINELASRPSTPAILVGDLNDVMESATLGELKKAWTSANEKPLPTIPVTTPARQIDFILFRPADRWKVVEVRVLDEAVASDHRAIFAVLELLPERK